MFNTSKLKARLTGRASFMLGPRCRLGRRANLVNLQSNSDAISIGENSMIEGELLTFAHGGKISIGKNCYIGVGTRIWSGISIEIQDYVLIAHNVSIMDNLTHPKNHIERRRDFESVARTGCHPIDLDLDDKPIVIECDAWIGAHALILRGVTVGARAIVAAGAVVTKNVDADTVVAGNPARAIAA